MAFLAVSQIFASERRATDGSMTVTSAPTTVAEQAVPETVAQQSVIVDAWLREFAWVRRQAVVSWRVHLLE
jgi:hypothetical protein